MNSPLKFQTLPLFRLSLQPITAIENLHAGTLTFRCFLLEAKLWETEAKFYCSCPPFLSLLRSSSSFRVHNHVKPYWQSKKEDRERKRNTVETTFNFNLPRCIQHSPQTKLALSTPSVTDASPSSSPPILPSYPTLLLKSNYTESGNNSTLHTNL